jgi:hypothetical protein
MIRKVNMNGSWREYELEGYLLDRRMVKPPQVRLGGVEAGAGVGSLILSPDGFLLVTFLAFFAEGELAEALHLPTWVLEDPALGPFHEAPTVSVLRVWAKIGIVGISISPSKLGTEVVKLSRTYRHTYREWVTKREFIS